MKLTPASRRQTAVLVGGIPHRVRVVRAELRWRNILRTQLGGTAELSIPTPALKGDVVRLAWFPAAVIASNSLRLTKSKTSPLSMIIHYSTHPCHI